MNIWAQIWPSPYPNGKVHLSVVNALSRKIGLYTRFETIYRLVDQSGISDDLDVLATTRTLRDKRDEWCKSYNPARKAITA